VIFSPSALSPALFPAQMDGFRFTTILRIMTIKEARQRLIDARIEQRNLAKEIKDLNQLILRKRGEPDLRRKKIIRRNIRIYKHWKAGKTFVQIAKLFDLGPERISLICRRIEVRKAKGDVEYKDL
jgi:hypothetical protein